MIEVSDSFLDTIEMLINLKVGDTARLEHVKNMILEEKPLYVSDRHYVENLAKNYNIEYQKTEDNRPDVLVNCRHCSTSIPITAKYCTLCGTNQKREYSYSTIVKKYNPLQIIPKPNSYQILVICGGLAVMIPVLFIMSRIDVLLESIYNDTGRNVLGMAGILLFLGTFSSLLSIFAMIITFVIKNPKKVGRVLFFVSFAILLTSVFVGIVGVVFILIASRVAYKKRHY